MSVKMPENVQKMLTLGQQQQMRLFAFRVARMPQKKERLIPRPKKSLSTIPVVRERQTIIARMTNWQSHQWSKAGFPLDLNKLAEFATLTKEKQNDARL